MRTEIINYHFATSTAAKLYDEILVPRLFYKWGRLLLDRIGLQKGEAVLDVATGPGTLARLASERIGPKGRVVGTDISAEMLDVARSKQLVVNGAPIEYIESPASPLNVQGRTFDVAVCQQGLQFFPDPGEALKSMHAALKPGGRLGLAIWRSAPDMPFFAAIRAGIVDLHTAGVSLQRSPNGLSWYRSSDLEQLLAESGFSKIRLGQERLPMTFEGGMEQAIGAVAATSSASSVAALSPTDRELFEKKLEARMKPYARDGKIVLSVVSHIAVAVA